MLTAVSSKLSSGEAGGGDQRRAMSREWLALPTKPGSRVSWCSVSFTSSPSTDSAPSVPAPYSSVRHQESKLDIWSKSKGYLVLKQASGVLASHTSHSRRSWVEKERENFDH